VNRLAGLLEFAGYLGGSFTIHQVATDRFLLLCQAHAGVLEGGSGYIFQFAIPAAPIIVQINGREEPAVNNAHTRNSSGLNEVHEVPITEVQLFCGFMCGQHAIEVLKVVV
jgi:hypothetical protein